MRTRIKICGLTRPEDVRAVVSAGVDAVGLVFYPPSPRAVDIAAAAALAREVPAFVTLTALFVDPEPELVRDVLHQVRPDLLQFHGSEPAEFCRSFARPYIKAHRVRADDDLIAVHARYPDARALLLDTYRPGVPGGTGEQFDWDLIPPRLSSRIVLAGGLRPDNVAEAVRRVGPLAVDVSGGVESAPGIKDPELVTRFVKEVVCADTGRS